MFVVRLGRAFICLVLSVFSANAGAQVTGGRFSLLPEYWQQYSQQYGKGAAESCAVNDLGIVQRFRCYEKMISGIQLYCPHGQLDDERPLVFWVIHGTWAKEERYFFDPSDAVFATIMDAIIVYAERLRRPVEVVSYCWSGVNTMEARRLAGSGLRFLIERFYSAAEGYGAQCGLAHSHGVNILLMASQDVAFDTIISLAAPVFESVYKPVHIKRLYHFYSIKDPVQFLGAVDGRSAGHLFSSFKNSRAFSSGTGTQKILNFRVMFDGVDPGHVEIKRLIASLWDVIDITEQHYQYHTHFNANMPKRHAGRGVEPHVSIRYPLEAAKVLQYAGADQAATKVVEQLKKEGDYSAQQEAMFASRYGGRNIMRASHWRSFILANWQELASVVTLMLPILRPSPYADYSLLSCDPCD